MTTITPRPRRDSASVRSPSGNETAAPAPELADLALRRPHVLEHKVGKPLRIPPPAQRRKLLHRASPRRTDDRGHDPPVVHQPDVPERHRDPLGQHQLARVPGIHRCGRIDHQVQGLVLLPRGRA
jgi:hypothetical protein